LAKIVGSDPMSRSEIVKRVWDHIKRNGLQDEGDPRMINTDEAPKTLCGGTAQVSLFDLTGFIGRHVKPVKGKGD